MISPLPTLAIVLAWLFSLQGTLGAYRWGYQLGFIGLGMLCLLPALGRLVCSTLASNRVSAATACQPRADLVFGLLGLGVTLLLSALSLSLAIAGASRLTIPPGLTLLDPARGIPPHPDDGGKAAVRVAIASDPHFGREGSRPLASDRILDQVRERRPDAFFLLGDTVGSGAGAAEWDLALARLARGLGPVPLCALLGESDAVLNGEGHFRQAFFPPGTHSDSGSPYYFSVAAGPVRFFILNLPWGSESLDRAQKAWLEKTLAATPPDTFKVVLSHSFFRASGHFDEFTRRAWYDHADNLREVAPLLAAGGVDLVVSGHQHHLEYLAGDGLRYALVGAMGGPAAPAPTHVSPARLWFLDGQPGYLELAAWPDRLELDFRAASGAAFYHVAIRREPARP
jgi:hypothetical protein